MTLQKKWDDIKGLIEERLEAFIATFKDLPKVLYKVEYNGKLKELPVIKVVYYNKDQLLYFSGKKPNREDVATIERIFNNLVFDKKYFRFRYDEYNSYSMEQIETDKMLFIDRETAAKLSKEITDRIAEEERLLAGGDHDRCQRCRRVVPKSQIITGTIIGRGRNSFGKAIVTQEPMKFCSGTCAAHEQWSREG